MSSVWTIRRSTSDVKVAGLCGGVARHWGIDPVLVRVGFVLLALTGGVGAILYVAGWLLLPVALSFDPARYTPTNSLALLALGLVPLGLGHTLYNAALRRIPAATVNIVATQEVTGGIVLAWLLLAEAPAPLALLGVAVTLAGVLLVLWRGRAAADAG